MFSKKCIFVEEWYRIFVNSNVRTNKLVHWMDISPNLQLRLIEAPAGPNAALHNKPDKKKIKYDKYLQLMTQNN